MTFRSSRAFSLAQVASGLAGAASDHLRPTISWRPVAAASSYRIRLVSREPEGRNQTLINETLKRSLQQSDLETMIRKAIREELMSGKVA